MVNEITVSWKFQPTTTAILYAKSSVAKARTTQTTTTSECRVVAEDPRCPTQEIAFSHNHNHICTKAMRRSVATRGRSKRRRCPGPIDTETLGPSATTPAQVYRPTSKRSLPCLGYLQEMSYLTLHDEVLNEHGEGVVLHVSLEATNVAVLKRLCMMTRNHACQQFKLGMSRLSCSSTNHFQSECCPSDLSGKRSNKNTVCIRVFLDIDFD